MDKSNLSGRVLALIVEDSRLFREGMKRILADSPYDKDAVAILNEGFTPSLLLLDFRENDVEDFDHIRRLRAHSLTARIVVLTNDVSTSKLTKALELGCDAYLLKDMSPEALIQSLTLTMLGEKVFPTNLAQLLIEGRLGATAAPSVRPFSASGLSEREMQILRCLVNGDPNKVIANRLKITEATVKVHLKGLLRKISVSNRTQAAIWAVERGIDKYPMSASIASPAFLPRSA
jgi:two-component system, NarL family, nitrate/nitrite response regulator NarL